ncbi:MAG: hypothetical protein ABIF87_18350 [Pseudomonadota bacterium]
MDKCSQTKSISLSSIALIVCLIFFLSGCGPSYEERQEKKEAERKELIRKNDEKEKHAIGQIANRHNAIRFPPKDIDATAFTYSYQRYFKVHSQDPVVFKGYLEDIEQTKNGIIVEFLCPLGENYFINKNAVRFRLTISEDSVDQFLNVKREDPMLHSLRYLYGPDYYVVAKIEHVRSYRMYEFDGNANGEEVEIESDVSKKIVSTGKFIDALAIPKN